MTSTKKLGLEDSRKIKCDVGNHGWEGKTWKT